METPIETASQLAVATAAEIREHGWTKNVLEDEQGRMCVRGAAYRAMNGDPLSAFYGFGSSQPAKQKDHLLFGELEHRLSNDPIVRPRGLVSYSSVTRFEVARWNNHPETTEADVLAALERASIEQA